LDLLQILVSSESRQKNTEIDVVPVTLHMSHDHQNDLKPKCIEGQHADEAAKLFKDQPAEPHAAPSTLVFVQHPVPWGRKRAATGKVEKIFERVQTKDACPKGKRLSGLH